MGFQVSGHHHYLWAADWGQIGRGPIYSGAWHESLKLALEDKISVCCQSKRRKKKNLYDQNLQAIWKHTLKGLKDAYFLEKKLTIPAGEVFFRAKWEISVCVVVLDE